MFETNFIFQNPGEDMKKYLRNVAVVPFFLGGSRLFGYDRYESDYDFFVFAPPEEVKTINLVNNLILNGFIPEVNPKQYSHCTIVYNNRVHNVHIGLMSRLIDYENLEIEHGKVRRFLDNNPEIRRFIRILRVFYPSIPGSRIYLCLLEMLQNPKSCRDPS